MQRTLAVLIGAGLALAPFGASYAQNPQPAPPGVSHTQTAPPSAPTPPPEKVAPTAGVTHGKGTLSDKLARQNGTLTPPADADRGGVIEPQHARGSMPVIKPPGTQGGDQHVVPK